MQVDSVALTNKNAAEVVASFVWATTPNSVIMVSPPEFESKENR